MTADDFSLRLSQDCLVEPGSRVLAAVSGGADSTALLCFLLQVRRDYPLEIACAHVEHGIRGESSMEDMVFVRALCEREHIAFYAARVDAPAYAKAHRCGLEDAARTLRYAFLQETAERIGADVIALAHHAGDQAETVLLHALRGSDLQGLCGMRMRSGMVIRPLLGCSAQELRVYLTEIGQEWREDESNTDVQYARNRVRHRVMPELERINPGAGDALCRLSRAAQRDEDYFSELIHAMKLRMLALVDGEAVRLDRIRDLHPALLSRIIIEVIWLAGIMPQSAQTIERIMDAVRAGEKATVNLAGGAYARLGRTYLCVNFARMAEIDVPLDENKRYTPFGSVRVRPAEPGETGDGRLRQAIPTRLLEGARITSRREGDAMIPFGMSSAVKVKKLLIDEGIDQGIKASIPILRTRDGEILWVIGLRPAESCRGEENEEKMIVEFRARWIDRGGEA